MDYIALIVIIVAIVLVALAVYITFFIKPETTSTTTQTKGIKKWYNYSFLGLGAGILVLGIIRFIMSFGKK